MPEESLQVGSETVHSATVHSATVHSVTVHLELVNSELVHSGWELEQLAGSLELEPELEQAYSLQLVN